MLTYQWTATACEIHDLKHHSARAQMAWSQRCRKSQVSLDTGANNSTWWMTFFHIVSVLTPRNRPPRRGVRPPKYLNQSRTTIVCARRPPHHLRLPLKKRRASFGRARRREARLSRIVTSPSRPRRKAAQSATREQRSVRASVARRSARVRRTRLRPPLVPRCRRVAAAKEAREILAVFPPQRSSSSGCSPLFACTPTLHWPWKRCVSPHPNTATQANRKAAKRLRVPNAWRD